MDSEDNLHAVPEENFTRERERMIDSYSKAISFDDNPSNERTITTDSDSSVAAIFEDTPCGWEADPKGIEATLHQSYQPPEHNRRVPCLGIAYVPSGTILWYEVLHMSTDHSNGQSVDLENTPCETSASFLIKLTTLND